MQKEIQETELAGEKKTKYKNIYMVVYAHWGKKKWGIRKKNGAWGKKNPEN